MNALQKLRKLEPNGKSTADVPYEMFQEKVEEILRQALCSGAGVHGNWGWHWLKSDPLVIVMTNFFICHDEAGGHDGDAHFAVRIDLNDPIRFELHFTGWESGRLNRRYGLRDYLEDSIFRALQYDPAKEKRRHANPA